MNKEKAINLLTDSYELSKLELEREYNAVYATEGITAKETMDLNAWFEEQEENLRDWFVDSICQLFTEETDE